MDVLTPKGQESLQWEEEAIDLLRMRTMHLTCIAGISGVCQVSIPFKNNEGVPVGVSLIGPAGSDLALIRLATALSKILPD